MELDWFVRRDGSFVPVSYSSAPMGRAGAVVVFRDVSERLAAEELSSSRARIVQAADAERRRIGRDLHDGAQQWLVRVLMGIEEARRDRAPRRRWSARPRTRGGRSSRLRDLAAGVHPLVLTDRGVAVALEELTARAPVRGRARRHRASGSRRRSRPPLYFTAAEALTNVDQARGRDRARIVRSRRDGDVLRVEVADDGHGGAVAGGWPARAAGPAGGARRHA